MIDAELSAKPNRVGFTGYQLDRATSEEGDTSYYAKARHYGARLGIFRSVDPLQGEAFSPSSLHRYGYGYDNPAAYVDPSGREAICITLGRDCFGHDVTPAEREQQFFTLGAMAAVPVVAAVLVESGTVAAAAWTATRLGGWRWGLAVATTQGAPLVETVAASGLAAAGAGELPPTPFTAVPKLAASASARVLDGELDAARIAASGEIDDVPRLASVASDLPAPTIIRTNSVAIGEASSGGGIAVQSERVQLSVAPAASSGPSARKLGNRQLPKSDRPWVRYQSHATGRDYEEMWQLEQRKVAADARRGGYTVEAKWAGRNDAAFSSSPYNPSHPFYDAERDLKQVQGLLELNRATGGKGVRYAVSNEAARQHFAAFFEANVPDAVASGELQVFHVPGNGM